MERPDWKAADPAALTRWIHAELDRQDELEADAQYVAANADENVRRLKSLNAIVRAARKWGMTLPSQAKRGRPGKTIDEQTDFDRAAADVPRIRRIFQQHWGKRNRTSRPLAEEIAAERWGLSPVDTDRLIDRFQRKSKVSSSNSPE